MSGAKYCDLNRNQNGDSLCYEIGVIGCGEKKVIFQNHIVW